MLPFNESVQKIKDDLNLNGLSPEEQEQAMDKVQEYFFTVIKDMLLARMSDDQFERFKTAMQSDNADKLEEETALISAEIPGFAEDLEVRLTQEYEHLKRVMKA